MFPDNFTVSSAKKIDFVNREPSQVTYRQH